MWLVELLKSIFNFGTSANEVAIKAMPSEKIQEEKFEIKKPIIELNERIKRQNKIFNKIKNVPDADVRSFVLEWTDLNDEDTDLMVNNITKRIEEYRKDYPIISGWRRFTKK